jgi:hypothetical protein
MERQGIRRTRLPVATISNVSLSMKLTALLKSASQYSGRPGIEERI